MKKQSGDGKKDTRHEKTSQGISLMSVQDMKGS